jgi:HJR/Mrr/RecB family endonuclease
MWSQEPHSSSVAGNIEALASDKDLGAYILWEQVNDSRDELRIQQLSTAVDANDGMVFEDGGLSCIKFRMRQEKQFNVCH